MRAKSGGGSPGLTSDLPFDSPDSESRVRSMGGGGGRGGGSTDVWRKRKRDRGGMTVVMNGPDENQRCELHTWAGIPICSYFSSSSGFGLPLQQISEMGTLS